VGLDIDHFKAINDTHGHAGGDAVLCDVARTINITVRSEDVFARVGGEEFVVLGRGLSLEQGAKMAERIRKLIEYRVFEFKGRRFNVTISAGVAEISETPEPPAGDKLLELADRRLYVAKREGRNRVVYR
jgi:diguanylate cyclase (GGDEF)-like protein